MRRRGKIDNNHTQVRDHFRALGCSVISLADMGQGVPDLLVGISGHNLLVEVKASRGKLTPDQEIFHAAWRGPIEVVRTCEQVEALVMRYRRTEIERES